MRLSNILLAVAVTLVGSSAFASAATDVNVASTEHSLPARSLTEGPNQATRSRFLRATETADEDEERAILPWIKDLLHFKDSKKYLRYVDYFNWAEKRLTREQVQKIMKLSDEQAEKSTYLKGYVKYLEKHKPGNPPIR
ncbi:hypothetical protein PHYBOEH_008989 [Phytophthora boehmeriae]|uniref:RxLR effector protein n=1 Tax=Phytophthora boehmeriae TaxID=109152 RepID=A0A8T1VW83_9STRA|nr:hypothetical protein PHYBOEH_008989 [Phytophthora boehmeriae]